MKKFIILTLTLVVLLIPFAPVSAAYPASYASTVNVTNTTNSALERFTSLFIMVMALKTLSFKKISARSKPSISAPLGHYPPTSMGLWLLHPQ